MKKPNNTRIICGIEWEQRPHLLRDAIGRELVCSMSNAKDWWIATRVVCGLRIQGASWTRRGAVGALLRREALIAKALMKEAVK